MSEAKIAIVIQARMGSTRLPGKVLMDFCGKPMLLFQIKLLKSFNICESIIVATSLNKLDDQIEAFCQRNKIDYLRGSEQNVFERFQQTAVKFKLDHIIRLTGDNPLPNRRLIEDCLSKHFNQDSDLTSTRIINSDHSITRFAPKGLSVDVLKVTSLNSINSQHLTQFEKEHVIPVFFKGEHKVSCVEMEMVDYDISYSIDDEKDYYRVLAYAQRQIAEGKIRI